MSYGVTGVLSWRGVVVPKFSAPPTGETMRQTSKSFRGARTCSRSSITMPCLGGAWISPAARAAKNGFCLFVCLPVTLLSVRVCAPDFAMKAWEYRKDFDAVGYRKVRSCAPMFNFLRVTAANWRQHSMPKSKKRQKLGFFRQQRATE